MSQTTSSNAIPLREWVPEAFDDTQPMTLKPGRYGIDPAPVGEHDGEPLTRAEAFKFWVPVMCFCAVAGLVVGLIVGSLKS